MFKNAQCVPVLELCKSSKSVIYLKGAHTWIFPPDLYGCPIPCKQKSFKVVHNYYHKNSVAKYTDGQFDENNFILKIIYVTLNMEQRIESLDYDFGNFLVAAGGNLGLLLGLACLPVLLDGLKYLEKVIEKRTQ